MRIVIYILIALLAVMMVIMYSLCVIAHEADKRADRMYRAWKESKDERLHKER